jgi:hypothetical protein
MNIIEILKLVWPLILIQVALQVYALYDLFALKKGKTKNLSKVLWAVIIVAGEILGAAAYLLVGRSEE